LRLLRKEAAAESVLGLPALKNVIKDENLCGVSEEKTKEIKFFLLKI